MPMKRIKSGGVSRCFNTRCVKLAANKEDILEMQERERERVAERQHYWQPDAVVTFIPENEGSIYIYWRPKLTKRKLSENKIAVVGEYM